MSCTVKFEVMRDNYPLQIGYWDRRKMLFGLGLGAGAFLTPGLFAESLMEPTPRQTEGPFYPDKMPIDTDNDLLVIGDSITPAVGEVSHLSGTILNIKGEPVKNALVEIWQVGAKGVYLHSKDNRPGRDDKFQGYGRFLTDSKGPLGADFKSEISFSPLALVSCNLNNIFFKKFFHLLQILSF